MTIKWISVKDYLPSEEDCIEGRVPTIDEDGALRYALLIDSSHDINAYLLSDTDPVFWLKGVPPIPTKV